MISLHVPKMSCSHCSKAIEHSVKSIDPTAELHFDMSAHSVEIVGILTEEAALKAIAEAGYDAEAIRKS